MQVRIILMSAATVLSCVASASFDLVLVGENAASFPKIHRYDGATGAYMGSFGVPYPISSMVGSFARKRVFASSASGVLMSYDYSTGELKGTASGAGSIALSPDQSLLYTASGNLVRTYNASNLSFGGTLLSVAGADFSAIAVDRVGRIHLYNQNADQYLMYSSTGSLLSTLSGFGLMLNSKMVANNQVGNNFGEGLSQVNGGASLRNINISGSSYVNGFDVSVSGMITYQQVAMGHTGTYVLGTESGGAKRIFYSPTFLSSPSFMFNPTQFGTSAAMTTVLAPEPASMLALATAGLVLAKRRRR